MKGLPTAMCEFRGKLLIGYKNRICIYHLTDGRLKPDPMLYYLFSAPVSSIQVQVSIGTGNGLWFLFLFLLCVLFCV